MSIHRTLRIVGGAAVAAALLAWWWFGGPRTALYGSSPHADKTTPSAPPTTLRSTSPGHRSPPVAQGRAFGTAWMLTSSTGDGSVCLFLSRSERSVDSGTCWQAGHGSVEVLKVSAPDGELWFGPAPRGTTRIWASLDDGRMAFGDVYRLPPANHPSTAYLIPVPRPLAYGTVIAVGKSGRLVGGTHTAASLDPGESVAALDNYGNVIGYVPAATGVALTPGRHAATSEIRSFTRYRLHRIRPAIRAWWDSRPSVGAADGLFERWWAAYPVDGLSRRSPASR